MTQRITVPPAEAIAGLATIRLGETELDDVLRRVAELTLQTVPGAESVSVTLVQGDVGGTSAHTGQLALTLDELQYQRGHGPCLDAALAGDTIHVDDMAAETRWPDYTPRAVEAGAGSSLSIGLPVQHPATGGLNIYATRSGAFDEASIEAGTTFAGYAAVAVANARLYSDTAAFARQMAEAMASRAVIEQAKGILMRDQACSPDDAFDLLRSASMRSNRKLRDVAAAVVEGAQKPTG